MNIFTKFSLKNISAVMVLCLLIVFGGIYSASTLKKETMPDISIPIVSVITVYPGASPSDIEDKVTKPIEELVSSVNGIKTVNSTSSENVSAIIAQFDYSANMEEMQRKIEDTIKGVKLPDNVQAPKVMRIDFNAMPVLNVSISNDKLSPVELEEKVRQHIIPAISGIGGVGQAQLASESKKAVYVKLIPEKLKKYNLNLQTVSQLLQANNVSFPVGSLSLNGTVEPVRVTGKFGSLEELKNLKLPVIPNTQALMSSSFSQIGQGVAQLGDAVAQMGKGIQGMSQAFNVQLQLVSAIQEIQAKLVASKFALSEATQTLNSQNATEQQKQIANATIQQLTPAVKMLETTLGQMQKQLKDIQAKIASQMPAASANNNDKANEQKNIMSSGNSKQSQKSTELSLISLRDIAEITVGTDKATSYSRTNGNPSINLQVMKTQEANTVDVSDAVKDRLETLEKTLPDGTEITFIMDQADYVNESVNGLLKEGLVGVFFAFIVILLFLRNLRTTIIACVSIPLSVLITLIVLKQANITLNILTLGGLSVAIGRIVDDSIVVIENIYRRLQGDDVRNSELIRIATKEVGAAITSSTLTTVAVFLPITFVGGLAGVMFKPFALTLAASMLSSLFVAVTVIPVLSKVLLLKSKKVKHSDFHEGRLMKLYESILSWSLNHKLVTLFIALALFTGSLFLTQLIGTSFMQEQKYQYVNIAMDYPAGTDSKVVNEKAGIIEKTLSTVKGIEYYQTTIGSSAANMMSIMSSKNAGSIMICLENGKDVDEIIKELKNKIPAESGTGRFSIAQSSPDGSGASSMNNIEVQIVGSDKPKIKEAAKILTEKLSTVEELDEVSNNLSESKPEISISVDQEKASKLGLSAAQVGMTLSSLLNDSSVSSVSADNKTLDILMGLKLDSINKVEDIKNIELASQTGASVKIKDIATVKEVPGAVGIYSLDGKEVAKVTGKIIVKDTGAISKKVEQIIKETKLPDGIETQMGGITQMMGDSFRQMGVAMIVAIMLVFFVMLVALGSIRAPLAILMSLPLAAIGGLMALFVTGLPLDMPSMIGALMLIGIVVTNAIVLIDRVRQKLNEGMEVRDALLEAGRVRMRPILMTAIATIAALMPLAVGLTKGSTMSQSLAVIVIGGLTTSTFLTLIVVPVVYELLENFKNRTFGKEEIVNQI
jgi:multidrug efflux pump subunit AcrB